MEDARPNAEAIKLSATESRRKAQQLLEQLMAELKESKALPGSDLYKQVTGHSSLEKAIDETRRMIACYDRVLEQIEKPIDKPEADLVVRRLAWQPRGVAV